MLTTTASSALCDARQVLFMPLWVRDLAQDLRALIDRGYRQQRRAEIEEARASAQRALEARRRIAQREAADRRAREPQWPRGKGMSGHQKTLGHVRVDWDAKYPERQRRDRERGN